MSSPTPSVSLSSSSEQVKGHGKEEEPEKAADYSQDSFEVEQDDLSVPLSPGGNNQTKPFSFEEDEEDVQEGGGGAVGGVDSVASEDVDLQLSLSAMSTIQEIEEPNSTPTPALDPDHDKSPSPPLVPDSDPESRVPIELQGLVHHFEGGGDDEDDLTSSSHSSTSNEEEEQGIDGILKKLQLLENTQNLLENVLDANNSFGGDASNVEDILHQALAQLNANLEQTPMRRKVTGQDGAEQSGSDTEADASLQQEVNSLRKLLDLTLDEDTEPGGGSPDKSSSSYQGRELAAVLQEYEELERSLLSDASIPPPPGETCDEVSFQSDKDNLPFKKSKLSSKPPLPPQFPWNENKALQQDTQVFFTMQQNPKNSEPKAKWRPHPLQPEEEVEEHGDFTLLDPTQFLGEHSNTMEEERSRTKTLHKKKGSLRPLSASKSTTCVPTSSNSSPGKDKGPNRSPYLSSGRSSLGKAKGSQSMGALFPTSPGSARKTEQAKETGIGKEGKRGGPQGDQNQSYAGEVTEATNLKYKLEEEQERVASLRKEVERQESLLQAYQEDNQKLYGALKGNETASAVRETEWEELVNSLKTEIATLKIQRFVSSSPSRPGSGTHKAAVGGGSISSPTPTPTKQNKSLEAEIDRLRQESEAKSQQITKLRKEILTLTNNLSEAQQRIKTPNKNAKQAWIEKEKEFTKTIKGLKTQVRTLQKILYNKDPSNSAALNLNLSRDDLYSSQELVAGTHPTTDTKSQGQFQITVLEARIAELERNLALADTQGKERIKDFQTRLNSLKSKYEEQLSETELLLQETTSKLKLAQNSSSSAVVGELTSKLERSSGEVAHLKAELGRTRRELEIAAKSSLPPAQTAKGDAATLTLALKSFKSELAEKEREVLKLKKDLGELQRTNGTLKREREKYLGGAGPSGVTHAPRIVSKTGGNVSVGLGGKGEYFGKPVQKGGTAGKRDANPGVGGPGMAQLLQDMQDTLEYERGEFETLLSHKKKEIEEKDKMIKKLGHQLQEGGGSAELDPDNRPTTSTSPRRKQQKEEDHRLLEELSSRLSAQNDLILRLKESLSHFRGLEEELHRCRGQLSAASSHIATLEDKLALAQEMGRPENDILALLAQKFESLNARYLAREQQMETLLQQLSFRTGSSSLQAPIATNQTTYSSSFIPNSAGIGNRSGIATQVDTRGSANIEQLLRMGPKHSGSASNSSTSSSGELDLIRQLSPSLYHHLFSSGGDGSDGRNLGRDIPEV